MAVFTQDDPPEIMVKNDRWEDTFDESKLYIAIENFDLTSSLADLFVGPEFRPGSVGLTFRSLVQGNAGRNIVVRISHAGETGVSVLDKSGTGTRADRYIYDFQIYDNENSNDRIIALLSGDPHLSVEGIDNSIADLIPIADTQLDNGLLDKLFLHNIKVVYAARSPRIASIDSELPRSFPHGLKAALGEKLSARLSNMDEGGDPNKAQRWEATWNNAVARTRQQKNASTFPNNSVRPG